MVRSIRLSQILSKLAIRQITRRKGQAALIVIGLMICTSVITGSLIVGDSMEYLVYESTFENLGEVDLVIRGSEFFNYNHYTTITTDPAVVKMIDKHAPLILLPCALEAIDGQLRENKANLYGIDEQFNTFGNLIRTENGKALSNDELRLGNNELIINDRLASKINVKESSKVRLFINNPDFSLDTVYSSQQGLNTIERSMNIKYVIEHTDLGRLQLDGRTQDTSNVYMNINQLQSILGIGNEINSILISNNGDKYSGIDNDDEVADALIQSIDSIIGYQELGFELQQTESNYLRLISDDIFFDNDIYETITEYERSSQPVSSRTVSSPVLTYFVNSITSHHNNHKMNYSIITGLDFDKDLQFGDFEIISPELFDSTNGASNINLGPNEIILLDWTAEQLGASVGEILTINYMALDQFYRIYNTSQEFTIKYIVKLSGKTIDPYLMPNFPGLEGKLDCVNWDPPFPVNISLITKADRDFWFKYQGTPKAYISLDQAQALWENNLGSLTIVKLNITTTNGSTHSQNLEGLRTELGTYLDTILGHSDAGLVIDKVKSDALATSSGMAIFPMMFLAFSSAIIFAGMALIVTIFLILAESRKFNFGLVRAMGMQKGRVIKLYMIEGTIYGLIAGGIGVLVGIFLGWGLIGALNSIWSAAVENYDVPFYFTPESLLYGFIAGFIITIITIYLTARHIANQNIVSTIYDQPTAKETKTRALATLGLVFIALGAISLGLDLSNNLTDFEGSRFFLLLFGPVLILLGLALLGKGFIKNARSNRVTMSGLGIATVIYIIIFSIYTFPQANAPTVELFFMVGLLLVITLILIIVINLREIANGLVGIFSSKKTNLPVSRYSLQNPIRRPSRTGLTITIFTLVIFLLAALSINIAIQRASVDTVSYEERGGFDIIAETSVPISIDLENETQRMENNIDVPVLDNVTVTEIKLVGPEGGTCSNMNTHYPPRLLGVPHEFITENAFRFQSTQTGSKDHQKTWRALEKTADENKGKIPIVVDYNTLVWIYNGALGEIYTVEDETGSEVELEVIGILENTVFGGTFVMSEQNLETLYPKSAEYRYALFKLKPGSEASTKQTAMELERALYMYGLDAEPIDEFINENREYERSFMVLFQAFLGLGLIVGMVGLGVVSARAVSERRFEIGVLRSIGFTRRMIMKSFLIEISFIGILAILLGQIIGILSSYLAFGAWTGGNYEFVLPAMELFLLAFIIYMVAILSSIYPAYRASKITPAEALRRIG